MANQIVNRLALLRPRIGLAVALGLAIAGCASQPPTASVSAPQASYRYRHGLRAASHTVAPGETVYHIAHEYGVSIDSLMAANDLTDPHDLRVGELLVIPGIGIDASTPVAAASAFSLPDPWSVPRADRQFAWPVTAGVVSSPFGIRHGTMHEGVDIAAPAGTPIYAADDGAVIFVGRLHGYGNVVILQHSGGYVTVYGHLQRSLVNDGERVTRGQQIAEMGSSGRANGPNLHFEVRFNNHAENPVAYLPEPNGTTGISFARNASS